MAAYLTRLVHRPPGYYRALNARSSADLDAERRQGLRRPRIGHTTLPENEADVYEVERLVQRRCGKVGPHPRISPSATVAGGAEYEYLVLWAGYRKEDASWVRERFITRPALQ